MKEQTRELKRDKEKEKHRQDKETGHEFLVLLLSSWFLTMKTDEIGHWFLDSQNLKI